MIQSVGIATTSEPMHFWLRYHNNDSLGPLFSYGDRVMGVLVEKK